jgi:hypothetical protein
MSLFTHDYKGLLPPAPAWPSLCTKLSLIYVDDSLVSWGPQLLRFSRLRELYLGWYSGAQATIDSLVPPELTQLHMLRRVTLLNVPLTEFPACGVQLGAPTKSAALIALVQRLKANGASNQAIARVLKISPSTCLREATRSWQELSPLPRVGSGKGHLQLLAAMAASSLSLNRR